MSSFVGRLVVGLALVVVGAAGCAAPEAEPREKKSSTTSTLGKPKPSIKTAASQGTTDKYGITEWRLFRGKQDLFMTGYNANGKAVKGVSLAFGKDEDGGDAQLVTRIHDGSSFAAARNLTTQNLTAPELPAGSADFLQQVLGDLGGIGALFNGLGGGADGAAAGGADLPAGAQNCGADITAILNQAISCTSDAGEKKAAQAACVAAAKKAAESAQACANVGAVDATATENAGTGGIDLSKLGLPANVGDVLGQLGGANGGSAGGIDLSKLLPADLQNPFANAGGATADEGGGLDIKNPFGGGLGQLFGNPENGDVGFESFGGFGDFFGGF